AHGLAQQGLKRGEPAALMLDNNLEHILLWLAINKLGAISAPVNTAFKGEYLRNQLADCGAKLVIAEMDYRERFEQIATALPDHPRLFTRNGNLAELLSDRDDAIADPNTPGDTA